MDDQEIPRGITTMEGPPVTVHFDGACQPPSGPGIATYGFTVEGPGLWHEESGLAVPPFSEHATNNVAEYTGAISALDWLRRHGYRGPVVVVGDSELVIRQMRGEYAVRAEHLRAYHDWLGRLGREFASVEWRSVPREENRRADELSKEALVEARSTARRLRPSSPPDPEEKSGDAREDPGDDQPQRTV